MRYVVIITDSELSAQSDEGGTVHVPVTKVVADDAVALFEAHVLGYVLDAARKVQERIQKEGKA